MNKSKSKIKERQSYVASYIKERNQNSIRTEQAIMELAEQLFLDRRTIYRDYANSSLNSGKTDKEAQ